MLKDFPVDTEEEVTVPVKVKVTVKVLSQPRKGELLSQAAQESKSDSAAVTSPSARGRAEVPAPPAPVAASSNGFRHATAAKAGEKVDNAARELENEIGSLTNQLSLEDKRPISPVRKTDRSASAGTPPPVFTPQGGTPQWKTVESAKRTPGTRAGKRPQLRLKLEDMPTPQQAEERAQRAATRLIAKRDAMEAAAIAAAAASGSNTPANGPSAAQQAIMKLNLSSSSESDLQSPSGTVQVFDGLLMNDLLTRCLVLLKCRRWKA
ncbi:unnamed protein product [Phytophthora fragariaefolia]|uniref:Unnamed protein product n=1 Tax=Phytophthora fragariaefolia TaxID=1490495 RepID=A0A9W6TQG8_9STRA|nr:unnamed protein product [Phytophthora fragariaefolia]